MGVEITYDGTSLRLDGELAPDLPMNTRQATATDKRRSFYGDYRQNVR